MSTEPSEDRKTRRENLFDIFVRSGEIMVDNLKEYYSRMSASFRFPYKRICKIVESGDPSDRMKCASVIQAYSASL